MAESSEILTLPTRQNSEEVKFGVYFIGLGGIGSWLVEPVMRFLHSKRVLAASDIILIDGDKYEENNRTRQVSHPKLLGMNKAVATAQRIRSYFPEASVLEVPQFISDKHATYFQQYRDRTFIFSCSDNNVCRKNLAKIAESVNFPNVSLFTGGNELTDGNSHLFHRLLNDYQTNTLIKTHPEIEKAADGDRAEMSCQELAALPSGGQIIVTNFFCAATMLMQFYQAWEAHVSNQLPNYGEAFFDITRGGFNCTDAVSSAIRRNR